MRLEGSQLAISRVMTSCERGEEEGVYPSRNTIR
ncbi:Uncharacterised protein [Vibrio cholerae]|nr:Uncharacterised protein [Vibrio cholerae]